MTIQELRLRYTKITNKKTIYKCIDNHAEILTDEYARFLEKQLCKVYNEQIKILNLLKE